MRKVPSIRAGAAVAMTEFNIHLSPPVTTPTLASAPHQASCDARKFPWWPYTNAKDFKANTSLIVVVLFCALICALAFNAAIWYLIRQHCGQRRQDDEKAEQGGKAEEEVPVLIYAKGMELPGAETECIICLSDFVAGEKIRVMEKCNHGFHLQCVQRWLAARSSCPTCRTNCSDDEFAVDFYIFFK